MFNYDTTALKKLSKFNYILAPPTYLKTLIRYKCSLVKQILFIIEVGNGSTFVLVVDF